MKNVLAKLAQKQDLIESDMTQYGVTTLSNVEKLMGNYSDISAQRVADLKAYLASL